jgi:hypothetical protein
VALESAERAGGLNPFGDNLLRIRDGLFEVCPSAMQPGNSGISTTKEMSGLLE